MEPKVDPNKRSCMNCYWFDFMPDHKPRTRACCYDGPIDMVWIEVEIPSPSGGYMHRQRVCGMWRDCGLLEKGLTKPMV